MNTNLTDITLVIDRSGSMESCRTDAEGGVNAFIRSQAAHPGEATLTLVQFDNVYEFVHRGVPIAGVPPYVLEPRGSTALYDAVGRAIVETGQRLAAMPEADRPGLVLFAIVTDGHENASTDYTGPHVKTMIEHQASVYNWQFTYLGANQDAILTAGHIGIAPAAAMTYSTKRSGAAFDALAGNVRRARAAQASGDLITMSYSDEERTSSIDENSPDDAATAKPRGKSRSAAPKS